MAARHARQSSSESVDERYPPICMRRGAAMLTAVVAQIRVFCSVNEPGHCPASLVWFLAGLAGHPVAGRPAWAQSG
jgi:hypothetical protein